MSCLIRYVRKVEVVHVMAMTGRRKWGQEKAGLVVVRGLGNVAEFETGLEAVL